MCALPVRWSAQAKTQSKYSTHSGKAWLCRPGTRQLLTTHACAHLGERGHGSLCYLACHVQRPLDDHHLILCQTLTSPTLFLRLAVHVYKSLELSTPAPSNKGEKAEGSVLVCAKLR